MTWYNSYTGFPYKHLGDDKETGIDCFNLCRLVFRNELNIDIPYTTSDYCNIVDEDWYTKTHTQFMLDGFNNPDLGWEKVKTPQVYDIIIMSLGSSHVVNHCAIYVDLNKMLQTMINRKSWIAPYGRYYKQYTLGIYRWKNLMN